LYNVLNHLDKALMVTILQCSAVGAVFSHTQRSKAATIYLNVNVCQMHVWS